MTSADRTSCPAYEAHDEVARIVEAWTNERPDLDPTPMFVLSRVTRLAKHLDRARRAAFADHGLETWEFDVLSSLRRAGEPYVLTPGDLIAEHLVTSGTMTNRIDRLQAKGLVTRSSALEDRRIVQVKLTEEGKTKVDTALASLLDSERRILAPLSSGEHEKLADLLTVLLAPFETEE